MREFCVVIIKLTRCTSRRTVYWRNCCCWQHIHSTLQLLYLSVQQSQCNSYAIRSQSVLSRWPQFNWACLQCSVQPMLTEHASLIACLHNFSGPALLSCLTYQLLGSQLWIASPLIEELQIASNSHDQSQVSKLRHNSRTKLDIKISHHWKRDNTVFYLHR